MECKNKTVWWILLAVVVIGGGWYLLNNKTPSEVGPIKIGVTSPLTGDAAVYGEPAVRMYQLAADEINKTGGIHGRQIVLDVQDDKCNGTDAANVAQKLVNVDNVQVILGSFCSGATLAEVPIISQAKVAMLSPGSSSPHLTDISPYFARNYPSDSAQGKILADIAYNDKGWRNVGFIREQTDYALGVYQAFNDEFTKLGGVTKDNSFLTETSDLRSVITKTKSENPDAVFLSVQTPAAAGRLLEQMQQLGWKPHLMGIDAISGDPGTVSKYANQLEGALVAEFGIDKTNPKFQAMIDAYKTKYGEEPPFQNYMQTAYDSVFLIADAIRAVGYDGTKIANWLHNDVRDWQGAAGSVTIQSNGDPFAGHRPEMIVGGKIVPYTK